MKRIIATLLSLAIMLVICPISENSNSFETPTLDFTSIPLLGSTDVHVGGSVALPNGAAFSEFRVTAYIRVAGNWWGPKPGSNAPFTTIASNGDFELQYASHGEAGDLSAGEIAIFLVRADTTELSFAQLDANSISRAVIARTSSEIRVDGVLWQGGQSTPTTPTTPTTPSTPSSRGYSVNYSPFVAPYDVRWGELPPESLIREHLTLISHGFDSVRFFTAQDNLSMMYDIAHELGLRVIGTAWIDAGMSDLAIRRQLDNLANLANAGKVAVASVGSEVLFRGDKTPTEMLGYVHYVRERLTVDVPVTFMDESRFFDGSQTLAGLSQLNSAVDVILYSHYPIFGGSSISNAAREVEAVYRNVRNAQGNKRIVIAETGWLPTSSQWYGSGVPNNENARRYWIDVHEWATSANVEVFWFNSFDEEWKGNEGRIDARHWGVFYADGRLKEAYVGLIPTEPRPNDPNEEPEPAIHVEREQFRK